MRRRATTIYMHLCIECYIFKKWETISMWQIRIQTLTIEDSLKPHNIDLCNVIECANGICMMVMCTALLEMGGRFFAEIIRGWKSKFILVEHRLFSKQFKCEQKKIGLVLWRRGVRWLQVEFIMSRTMFNSTWSWIAVISCILFTRVHL